MIGDCSRCWMLMSMASRILIALGYHKLTGAEPPSEELDEIRPCVAWCYRMDKVMSMLLLRPQSLPRLQTPASSLIIDGPWHSVTKLVRGLMDLTQVQEAVLDLNALRPWQDISMLNQEYKSIHQKLSAIYGRIDEVNLQNLYQLLHLTHHYRNWQNPLTRRTCNM